jgi:hypothetical protein
LFAAPIGELTPEQRTCFFKWCNEETATFDKSIGRTKDDPAFIIGDYTQTWEEAEPDTSPEKINNFWKKVEDDEDLLNRQDFGCILVKIFPDDVIKDDLKEFIPASFIRKRIRYDKVVNTSPKHIEKDDWHWLSTFLDLARAVCGKYAKSTQNKQPPVIVIEHLTESMEVPPFFIEPSGVGVPDAITAYQTSIEDSDGAPSNVRDKGMYADMLRALMDSKNPDEKYRHYAMYKSGMSYMAIAKSENPDWETQYGREQAKELWKTESNKIRMQVQRFEAELPKIESAK